MITENIPPQVWFSKVCWKNGVLVSDRQLQQIQRYVDLLLQWNKKVNLVSRRDEKHIWQNHILHCASLLFKLAFPKDAKVVDIGTGGGLPGIPLKILRPDLQVTMIDATQKKVNAVQSILSELALVGISVFWGRAEEAGKKPDFIGVFDVVVARAVAPLSNLVKWSMPFLKKSDGKWAAASDGKQEKLAVVPPVLVAMKGGELKEEIEQVRRDKAVHGVNVVNLVYAGSEQILLSDKKVVLVFY
ncbi:MAG: 16S rRNA (guanine(527)-N(7))-methyltransferase RsmG [Bacteroidota bacterium]